MADVVYGFIPAYMEADYIRLPLSAVIASKKQGKIEEVVVGDDGSTDDTLKVAYELLHEQPVSSLKNQTFSTLDDHTRVWDLKHGILFSHRDSEGKPLNRNKAQCFLTAAGICHSRGVDVLAMVDADMTSFNPECFNSLVSDIKEKPDVWMTRCQARQEAKDPPSRGSAPSMFPAYAP